MEIWYLLYNGTSCDGRGDGEYCGRTMEKYVAIAHLAEVLRSPYNVGRVVAVFPDRLEYFSTADGLHKLMEL